MPNPLTGGRTPLDWHSDAALAYAIFRLTFGVNIAFRGIVRIFINGLDAFSQGLMKQFEMTWIPGSMIGAFGHVVPFVEAAIGIMLIVGLGTRWALVIGGLLMTSLTFGTMFLQNFDLAWLQLTYSIAFFLLLAARSWNVISLDAMMSRDSKSS